MSGQTIKLYLSAVHHPQITLGLGDPRVASMPQVEYVVRGYKKSVSTPPRVRLSITLALLWSLPQVSYVRIEAGKGRFAVWQVCD